MLLLFVPAFVPFLPNPLFGEKMRITIKLAIINVLRDQIGENSNSRYGQLTKTLHRDIYSGTHIYMYQRLT